MHAFSPKGTPIVGSFDVLEAKAIIKPNGFSLENGEIKVAYEGSTDLLWDTQKTVVRNGQKIYVDEDFNGFPEDDLILHEAEDISPEELAHSRLSRTPILVAGSGTDRILFEAFNIEWDTSDDDDYEEGESPDLPKNVVISVDPEDEIDGIDAADVLSDRFGFCVSSYALQRLKPAVAG